MSVPETSDGPGNDELGEELVVRLARMLHLGGAPAHVLEQRMERASVALGVPARFFSTPTSLFVTFDNRDHSTRLIRVQPAGLDLRRLSQLFALQQAVESRGMESREALDRLLEIERATNDPSWPVSVISFGLVAACTAVFMGSGGAAVAASGSIGTLVGLVAVGLGRWGHPEHLVNVLAAFTATLLANLVQWWLPFGAVERTVLASLIVLLPGLSVTVSINELATQNLASGTARMAGALTTFLTLAFGFVMGQGLINKLLVVPAAITAEPLGIGWVGGALVLVSLCFVVLFRAAGRDFPWILLAAGLAFGAIRISGIYLGPYSAVWVAALVAGLASNLFARFTNRPAAVMLMPAMIMLVPGSLGFFSLSAFAQEDVEGGLRAAFQMTLIAVSIVAGLLVSNAILPSTAPVRSVKQSAT